MSGAITGALSLATLADPRFDARSARGIATETEMAERDVAAHLAARGNPVRERRAASDDVWHLRTRPLSRLRRSGLSPFPLNIDSGLEAQPPADASPI